jgi:tetrahydromethanopterin S-methyltransferase subunit G
MKITISENRIEQLIFKYLDKIFEKLEKVKGKYYDIVFKYPGEEYGILGWEKSGMLWIYYKLIDNISSIIPIEKSEIQKIIGRYVEDRFNLEVRNTEEEISMN